MYSSEHTSGFSGPAASHLAAPPSPRHEGNVGQAPRKIARQLIASSENSTAVRLEVSRTAVVVWWRRRELNPGPKIVNASDLHV
jgi:hypothetical protein